MLSGSRIATLACPYAYWHKYERGLVPKEDEALRHAGTVIHAGLAPWYDNSDDPEHRDIDGLTAASAAYADFTLSPGSKWSYLTWPHLENVLRLYFDYWRERETFEAVGGEEMLASEALAYRGRLDLPVRDQSGQLYVMDHKATTGNMGDYWFAQEAISNKNRGYVRLLAEKAGEPVAGVVINGIYMGNAERKPDSRFQRRIFHYVDDQIDEWADNVRAYQREIEWRRENDCWPQQAGYQCRGCDYLDVCKAPRRLRERILERDYERRDD